MPAQSYSAYIFHKNMKYPLTTTSNNAHNITTKLLGVY